MINKDFDDDVAKPIMRVDDASVKMRASQPRKRKPCDTRLLLRSAPLPFSFFSVRMMMLMLMLRLLGLVPFFFLVKMMILMLTLLGLISFFFLVRLMLVVAVLVDNGDDSDADETEVEGDESPNLAKMKKWS